LEVEPNALAVIDSAGSQACSFIGITVQVSLPQHRNYDTTALTPHSSHGRGSASMLVESSGPCVVPKTSK